MFGKIFALDDIRFKHWKLRSYGETGTRLINELVLEYMQFFLVYTLLPTKRKGIEGRNLSLSAKIKLLFCTCFNDFMKFKVKQNS